MKNLPILLLLPLLSIPLLFQSTPTEIIKLRTFDALVKEQDPSGNFVILNITEEDVAAEGGYPLPRQRLAEIHQQLLEKGAIGVGWSISFPQPDRMGGDDAFAEVLGWGGSVLAMFTDNSGNYPESSGTVVKGEDIGGIVIQGVVQNLNKLQEKSLQGIATAPTDVDNLIRKVPLLVRTTDNQWIPSFATQIYKALFGVKTYIIKTNDNGIEEISIRGIPPVKTDSNGMKWISWVNTPQTDLQNMDVMGRYVIIGVTASGVMPQLATPAGLLEPHKIQAALAESILIQDSPYIPDYAIALELLIYTVSVSLVWILISYLGITWGITSSIGIMALTAFTGFKFITGGLLVDVTWSLISQFITGSTGFYLRFREQYKLRQLIKKQFEHYLDPAQVDKLQKNPDLLKLGGEKRYCTYLFTDLRGFTAMTEKLKATEVAYIMNRVLTVQVAAVTKRGGMVDKFIGDAGMYIFGAPLDLDNHERLAIEAAQEILEEVEKVSEELQAEGLPSVAVGVGTQSGIASIGNMGSDTRFDYSAIGDAVNQAARLESATKDRGVSLLIGDVTAEKSGMDLKELVPIAVKGKSKPLKIFTVI